MAYRILVVDDEPDLETLITQRFRKRIRSEELSFVFAGNGEEALAKLQTDFNPDVVLTDINMPVMDGLTLLSRLSEAHPVLRSVIVSAYDDMHNIRTALNRGAFDFVTKPIDFKDLEITLDKAIGDAVLRKQSIENRDRLVRLDRELDLARDIQESLVPCRFPRNNRFEVYGTMIPAAHVGGDLFDFFLLNPSQLAFSVGDVSGKGVPAALFMAVSRTLIRVAASKTESPSECLHEVNRFLCPDKTNAIFLTCFSGTLNLDTGKLEYSSAAHNPPYLLRANPAAHGGAVHALNVTPGVPLALFESAAYETATVSMESGDTLILFTDGITEARDANYEFYGEERLVGLLEQHSAAIPVQEIVSAVIGDANSFMKGEPASDDMTVLGIRYLGDNLIKRGHRQR